MTIKPLNDLKLIEDVKNLIEGKKGFLVGGCVRDWYLGKKCLDIDFTFSSYPIDIAEQISKKYSMKLKEFKNFLTITLSNNQRKIDFATFRKEVYPKPASLPIVSVANDIEEDLKRRDFSINAMALSIEQHNTFSLIDPFNGINDIKKGIIRVLHNRSFIDDPTRIFRGIRFAIRFGWQFDEFTLHLIKNSKDYVKLLSKERIRNEIIKILMEKRSYECLNKIIELKILEPKDLFDFDKKIDRCKSLNEKYIYIAVKNKSIDFFERYNFERKIKKMLYKVISGK